MKRADFVFSSIAWILLILIALTALVLFVLKITTKVHYSTEKTAKTSATQLDITKCLVAPYGDPCCSCFYHPMSAKCINNDCEAYVEAVRDHKGCNFLKRECEKNKKLCVAFCSKYPSVCTDCNLP